MIELTRISEKDIIINCWNRKNLEHDTEKHQYVIVEDDKPREITQLQFDNLVEALKDMFIITQ